MPSALRPPTTVCLRRAERQHVVVQFGDRLCHSDRPLSADHLHDGACRIGRGASLSCRSTTGTLRTDTPKFGMFWLGTILVIGALTFFPALVLGPVAEYFAMKSGTVVLKGGHMRANSCQNGVSETRKARLRHELAGAHKAIYDPRLFRQAADRFAQEIRSARPRSAIR